VRRKHQEITDKNLLNEAIAQAQVLRLGLCKDDKPYVVPLSFGYEGDFIYFHCAKKGMKIDYLKANPAVCFELESAADLIRHESKACEFNFSYRSVIGFGEAIEIAGMDEKRKALKIIMAHYSDKEWDFPLPMLLAVGVWKIRIASLSGKQSEDKI
jgi:nitroimidazol reductase NimA-like FMN-containing flavoprotein (pyridoxamine 5'-phosphate oxidase superfamily)